MKHFLVGVGVVILTAMILYAEITDHQYVKYIESILPYFSVKYINFVHYVIWTVALLLTWRMFLRVFTSGGFIAFLVAIIIFYFVAQPLASAMSDSFLLEIPASFARYRNEPPIRELVVAWPIVMVIFIHTLPASLVVQFFSRVNFQRKSIP